MTSGAALIGRVLVDEGSTLVRILRLGPGEVGPWHWHTHVTDETMCLEGKLLVDLEQPTTTIELVAGTAHVASVPPHKVHRVRNPAAEPAVYLLIQHGGRYDFNELTVPDDPQGS